jgi:hypothetical protein
MAVAIILIALATTAVIIRVILRKTKKIAFAADDYFIIGALVKGFTLPSRWTLKADLDSSSHMAC